MAIRSIVSGNSRERGEEAQAMKKTLDTLIVIWFLIALLFFNSYTVYGQDIQSARKVIQLIEEITVDPRANFQGTPASFSFTATDDFVFFIPDSSGAIKLLQLEKNKKFLRFLGNLGPELEDARLIQPRYCDYDRYEEKLSIIDYGADNVLVFDRSGKDDFELVGNISCPNLGYDTRVTKNGGLVISGFIYDAAPYDLYKIEIGSGKRSCLLPSHEKYNLGSGEEYIVEYRINQSLPAVGIKAFIDIQGENLFFVWEGSPRIIKLNPDNNPNLSSKQEILFGRVTDSYVKPNIPRLRDFYRKGEFEKVWENKKTMAYVKDIFATPRHVFLVYATGKNEKNQFSKLRLQVYTPEGDYLDDILIPSKNAKMQLWLDKENYDLYAFTERGGKFVVLRYSINKYK